MNELERVERDCVKDGLKANRSLLQQIRQMNDEIEKQPPRIVDRLHLPTPSQSNPFFYVFNFVGNVGIVNLDDDSVFVCTHVFALHGVFRQKSLTAGRAPVGFRIEDDASGQKLTQSDAMNTPNVAFAPAGLLFPGTMPEYTTFSYQSGPNGAYALPSQFTFPRGGSITFEKTSPNTDSDFSFVALFGYKMYGG